MKKRTSKKVERSLEKDYIEILKNAEPTGQQQWTTTGDAFVKFSLYENNPTVARPYTVYEG